MDWNAASQRGQRLWVHVQDRSARIDPRVQAPWHVRLARLLVAALVLGLLAIFGVLALGVGLIVIAGVAVVVLVKRAWRAMVGGFQGDSAQRGRRNVRVGERPR